MYTPAYDVRPPPDHPYTRSYSAYSALVQLYARSGQLPTADVLFKRGKLKEPQCRLGCGAIEDQHHVFVKCGKYREWREKAAEELAKVTGRKLSEKDIGGPIILAFVQAAKSLFIDDPSVWPLQYSFFYLGHVPPLEHLLPNSSTGSTLTRSRLLYTIAADWHLASIRLAGRIWGDLQRTMATRNGPKRH